TAKTEVGRLGLALNAMLARLEHAFARQRASEERLRAFLADASHELRTPLS
ncbi:MAG: histidine kinase, partial [Solirubrobacterales bacterium]|nr:histidine kinase [Solirubrobacterales bacterium]